MAEPTIVMVDYGMGNLRSVVNAFEAIGQPVCITSDPGDLKRASAIILPGVGAFGDGMKNLRQRGLIEPLQEEVLEKKKPYLGICLGMQFLAQRSFEDGCHPGLGWIDAEVKKIVPDDSKFRVPHIGWNDVHIEREGKLLEGVGADPVFYFVHSYYVDMAPGQAHIVTSTCWHGVSIAASLECENILGVQFHPEKSQRAGIKLLRNFVDLVRQSVRA